MKEKTGGPEVIPATTREIAEFTEKAPKAGGEKECIPRTDQRVKDKDTRRRKKMTEEKVTPNEERVCTRDDVRDRKESAGGEFPGRGTRVKQRNWPEEGKKKIGTGRDHRSKKEYKESRGAWLGG